MQTLTATGAVAVALGHTALTASRGRGYRPYRLARSMDSASRQHEPEPSMSRRFPEAFLTYDRMTVPVRESQETPPRIASGTLTGCTPSGPVAVFTPEGYEPNYAYPLIVWFHDAGESEHVLRR